MSGGPGGSAADGGLLVGLLGPVEVRGAGQALAGIAQPMLRTLVAMLAIAPGRVVSDEALVDALWGDSPPRTAVHVVEVYVSDLRRALPAGVLATSSPGYVLRVPPDAVDLHAFEGLVSEARVRLAGGDPREAAQSLTQALALWRGPVLQDLADEGFVRVEALRLEELRLEAVSYTHLTLPTKA